MIDPGIEALIDAVEGFAPIYERWVRRRLGDGQMGLTLPRLRLLIRMEQGGPQKMSELARQAKVTPRMLTTLVDGLEREGLARRRPHESDRRATIVEITPAGATVVKEKAAPYWAAKTFLFGSLDQEERRLMQNIYENLSKRLSADLKAMGDGEQ